MSDVKIKENYRKALELYYESAEKGDAQSQLQLGKMFFHGIGIERDYQAALEWMQKSAAQGNGEAQAYLGTMAEKGLGVTPDVHQAVELFKKAAQQDNAFAELRLGDFYLDGLAGEQNPRQALHWYRKAAAQDQDAEIAAQAQFRLGGMYCRGNGVKKDLAMGFAYYERSAKLDNAEAQFCLGEMYEDGVGVEQDHEQALAWFQKSSQKSKTPSNSAMGDIYRDGLIVEKSIPEAMMWYKKAAEEGDPYAKTELVKLQGEESTQKKAGTVTVPANMEAARAMAAKGDTHPAGIGAEKISENVRAGLEKSDEQEARPPENSELKTENTVPEIWSPAPAPEIIEPAKKAHAPRKSLYLFSALGVVVLALTGAYFGIRNKPAGTMESMDLGAAENRALPRPDPGEIPPQVLSPPGEILKKIAVGKPFKKSAKRPPVVEVKPAPVAFQPVAPILRRETKSLDEGEVAKMLAAKNMFDAARNPGGNFRHDYEIRNDSGLRLIVDRATNLVWTRQQNPVRMNLKKSLEWIASLNNVAYGGGKKWRLPTIEEAASLLKKDGGKTFLDAVFGKGIHAIWTGDGFSASESWIVDFRNGRADHAKDKSRQMILMVSSNPD